MMYLSFMTFVCPEYELDKALATAIRYGYEAIEPRAQEGHNHGIEVSTTKKERTRIKAQFADTGIKMCCLATSCRYAFADAKDRQQMIQATKQHIELAADCGCPVIRVFGGATPEGMDFADAKKHVSDSLAAVADFAKDHDVHVCLETHDAYCRAADAAEVVARVGHPHIAINWDMMHCIRAGETMPEAFSHVRDYVRHTHIHDGTWPAANPADITITLMGEGMVSHDEAVKLLAAIDYQGALSGEWIAAFEPEEILPHDAARLREYIAAAEAD